jgi:hypothetical protein
MNRIVISIPNSSPANLVNLFRTTAALNIAMRNSMAAVQMQTLSKSQEKEMEMLFSKTERQSRAGINIFQPLPSSPWQKHFFTQVWLILGRIVDICVHDNSRFCNSHNK